MLQFIDFRVQHNFLCMYAINLIKLNLCNLGTENGFEQKTGTKFRDFCSAKNERQSCFNSSIFVFSIIFTICTYVISVICHVKIDRWQVGPISALGQVTAPPEGTVSCFKISYIYSRSAFYNSRWKRAIFERNYLEQKSTRILFR